MNCFFKLLFVVFLIPLNLLAQLPGDPLYESEALKQANKLAFAGGIEFESMIAPILDKYCTDCHNPDDDEGNLNLEEYLKSEKAIYHPEIWESVAKNIEMNIMPPIKKTKRPSTIERALLVGWATQNTLLWDNGKMGRGPGRTTLRRLNKNEYNYTIRDLFGIKIRPADKFPEDASGEAGFNNQAQSLVLAPLLMENYFEAAIKVADTIYASFTLRKKYLHNSGQDAEAAKNALSFWAPRIYRRNVEADELDRLLQVYQKGRDRKLTHMQALRDPLVMMLSSPSFLYRSELYVNGGDEIVALNDFEFANRLSYFLWSSMPDQKLFSLAQQGKLTDPVILEEQVIRMLKDEKSRALAMHFAGQWLGWEKLRGEANPNTKIFKTFTFPLRVAMYQESTYFFRHLLTEGRSLYDLLSSDYSFLNELLAKHYGFSDVAGSEYRKVKLPDPNRGGVLGMGSVLVATSMPQRTSPTIRGAYILETLLGDPPPTPPMDIEPLPPNNKALTSGSFRESLNEHRDNPNCFACHVQIDPLGFGLDGFDAIGRWRTMKDGIPVDTSGALPDGTKFNSPAQLKKILLSRKEEFVRHAVDKFIAYALGRQLTPYDRVLSRRVTEKVVKDDGSIQTLILELVKSETFLNRRNPSKN